MHRFPRVAAVVLLEYLGITVAIGGPLLGVAALHTTKQPQTCSEEGCLGGVVFDAVWEEAVLYFAALVFVSLVCSLIVMAFRQRRLVGGHPVSQETSLFGSASSAAAWGFVWGLLVSPLALVALNVLLNAAHASGIPLRLT